MIRDPLGEDIYLILVTAKEGTKGKALHRIKDLVGNAGPTIAAGDDLNDISMLEEADIRIVMEGAPKEMLSLATIIGRHGKHHAIIEALTKATSQV
jgi:hydroxymethylpyrimidine pyrophosphatase-like HAD family hydrolase